MTSEPFTLTLKFYGGPADGLEHTGQFACQIPEFWRHEDTGALYSFVYASEEGHLIYTHVGYRQ